MAVRNKSIKGPCDGQHAPGSLPKRLLFALLLASFAEKYSPHLLKKRGRPTPTFRHRSNTCETSSRRLLRNFMPSLKAKPGSGCAVETKVIGQYSPQHSDWHVQCGPKIRISSALALRCGLQIESRFFSKDKHSRMNLRMNDVEGRRDLSNGATSIICG